MRTNNENGRRTAFFIGIYFIAKAVLNMILGGSFTGILWAAVETVLLYTGLQFINFAIVAITAFTVISNFGNNISNIGDNWIYLVEAVIDVACCAALVVNSSVKQHFTNKWNELSELIGK